TIVADMPACGNTWTPNYIVVKVPAVPTVTPTDGGVALSIDVVRVNPAKPAVSADFKVTTAASRPGICSITPDNGPPGTPVVVKGEGFGSATPSPADTPFPRNAVEFFLSSAKHCLRSEMPGHTLVACTADQKLGDKCTVDTANDSVCVPNTLTATDYGPATPLWSSTLVNAKVPGDLATPASWPKSGPVYVIAANQISSNAIPFKVQDCNKGGVCGTGLACCGDGICKTSCGPDVRRSAFSWKFSTGRLPTLPIVVERQACDLTANLFPSPNPMNGSTDACTNAAIGFVFSRDMASGSFGNPNVDVKECGTAAAAAALADCTATAVTFEKAYDSAAKTLFIRNPTPAWSRNTWYRVILKAAANSGISDTDGKHLDGNYDGGEGGDYILTFKVRDSAETCALSNVAVSPTPYTVTEQNVDAPPAATPLDPKGFHALLVGANCNFLSCKENNVPKYRIEWSTMSIGASPSETNGAAPGYLTLPAVKTGDCLEYLAVQGVDETPPAATVTLKSAATPIGQTLTKEGGAAVTVKFADPRVVSYAPNCNQACSNGVVSAIFNVPMDPATFTTGTILLERCRDAACNPPLLPGPAFAAGDIAAVTDPVQTSRIKGFAIWGSSCPATTPFSPNTWYLVTLKKEIRSASGVLITGLNTALDTADPTFTWKFRTRDSAQSCAPSRAAIVPPDSTVFYVGARQDLKSSAFSAAAFRKAARCSGVRFASLRASSQASRASVAFQAPTPCRAAITRHIRSL
ncbi:MAG: Ig-like domain-containing protein, partial [Patescibacteria group bacterium]